MNNGMLNTAVHAARLAGKIILNNFERKNFKVEEKNKNDLVTSVDHEVEQAIKNYILEKYPSHRFLGEEYGEQTSSSPVVPQRSRDQISKSHDPNAEYLWIVDPIDGTTNFVQGIPHVAVSIALKINGRTELGVVYDPIRDEMFQALRGQGCEMNDRRLRVADSKSLDGTIIATSFPHRKRELVPYYTQILMRVFSECADIRRAGTASLDLAYVAAGRLDGYFELGLGPWDLAAGELMVREAGGLVSDFDGNNKYEESGNIVKKKKKILRGLLANIKAVKKA